LADSQNSFLWPIQICNQLGTRLHGLELDQRNPGVDIRNQFVVVIVMTIRFTPARCILLLAIVAPILQVPVVTAQNQKSGVTVSYEQSGTSRIARFKNSNPYPVRVEFSYQGTKTRGSGEASGEDAVFVAANFFATYGARGLSITSVRIKGVMRSD
jgi:hypothetical protein